MWNSGTTSTDSTAVFGPELLHQSEVAGQADRAGMTVPIGQISGSSVQRVCLGDPGASSGERAAAVVLMLPSSTQSLSS